MGNSKNIQEVLDYVKSINLGDFADMVYNTNFGSDNKSGKISQSICCLPGHQGEKTPSLTFYKEANTLTCFGCEEIKNGDIIELVSMMEGLETEGQGFIEILKFICEKDGRGIELITKPESPEVVKLKKKKTGCAAQYVKELWEDKTSYGFQYLLERGLTEETMRTFHLGLTSKNEARYGRMGISNRISIPILSSNGKEVIACSFRKLTGSDSDPKYIHDTNDAVFQKGNVFYGWPHAIAEIIAKKHVYIVEGYFDMISLYQAGLKNTLACMSNRMTTEQIEVLARVVGNITIVMDQDSAGEKGLKDTLPEMLRAGINVKVVPNLKYLGKDANDLCNKLDWDEMKIQGFMGTYSKDGVQYVLSDIFDKYDSVMLQAKQVTAHATKELLDSISDPLNRKIYEDYQASRLR